MWAAPTTTPSTDMPAAYYKREAEYYLRMAEKYPEAGSVYQLRSWEFLFLMAEAKGEGR